MIRTAHHVKHYITYSFLKSLQIKSQPANIAIRDITNAVSHIKHKCNIEISSNLTNYKTKLSCLVMECITDDIRRYLVNSSIDNIIRRQQAELADPNYNQPGRIDILMGASLFWEILHNNK